MEIAMHVQQIAFNVGQMDYVRYAKEDITLLQAIHVHVPIFYI
jgi:hypothetical protein